MDHRYANPLPVTEEHCVNLAEVLRTRGALVVLPGDTSSVAELVRATLEFSLGVPEQTLTAVSERIVQLVDAVATDPNVQDWAAKGLKHAKV